MPNIMNINENVKLEIDEFYQDVIAGHNDWLQSITYVPSITFKPSNAYVPYEETEVYLVKLQKDLDKVKEKIVAIEDGPITRFENEQREIPIDEKEQIRELVNELYIRIPNKGYMRIATMENGIIQFTQEYLEYVKNLNPMIYDTVTKQNGNLFELEENELETELDKNNTEQEKAVTLEKQELEQRAEKNVNTAQKAQKLNEQNKEEKAPQNEEQNIEKIAEASGIDARDLQACSTINPKEKVTDMKTFEEITHTQGKYTTVYASHASSQTKGTSRFAFWGITLDGKAEQLEGLEERNGVNTGKEIIAINNDGSQVTKKQTSALFTLNGQEEGISVTVGQYGMLEMEYIRKDPTEQKYIGSTIRSTHQLPYLTHEVQEFMNDKKTNRQELDDAIERAEHQLDETNTTKIKNIDENPNNNEAIDPDEDVELHDGTTTTLSKEAENLNMSLEDYRNEYEDTEGDCPAEKIQNMRIQAQEQTRSREDREIETPEEVALRRAAELQEREEMKKMMNS